MRESGDQLRVLIIGGYGTFGGRLARVLCGDKRLTLLIGGRSLKKAEAFCARWRGAAKMLACRFDRNGDLKAQLAAVGPDVVVDATGPFQAFVSEPYKVASAAVAVGAGYLDLADGRAFVSGIGQLDSAARGANTFVLSGVSTCPALTGAAVRDLATDFDHVDEILGGIAPSPFAPIGVTVVRAIAGYAGKEIELLQGGERRGAIALCESRWRTIAPPGCPPMDRLRFSLVDVPEYDLFLKLFPGLQSIWFGAGTRPQIWLRGLNAFALLVRFGLVRGLSPLADMFHRVLSNIRWGRKRGGMFVEVAGCNSGGGRCKRSWHLVAEGEDGVFVPAMAAAAIIQKVADGVPPSAGARAANNELSLCDFEKQFSALAIRTGVREEVGDVPVYRRVLGHAFEALPAPIRDMHDGAGVRVVAGLADVERGDGLLSRLIGRVMGFPAAGREVPVEVRFDAAPDREIWTRDFGGSRFSSVHSAGAGRSAHLVDERFGWITISLALEVRDERLYLSPQRWSMLGVGLPRSLMPYGTSFESVDELGRFCFDVEISIPFVGRLVRYRGYLEPVKRSER